jgi:hypothetical protein
MDIDLCIKAYVETAKEIFSHENFIASNKVVKIGKALVGAPRFNATVLERNIKKSVRENMKKLPKYQNANDHELDDMKFDFEMRNGKRGPECKVQFHCVHSSQIL